MITLHHKLFDYKKVKQAIARLNTTNADIDIMLNYRLHFFLRLFSVLGSKKLPMKKITSLYNSSDLERCIDSMRHAAAIQTAPIKIVKDSGWGLALQDTTSLLLSRRMVRTTRFF